MGTSVILSIVLGREEGLRCVSFEAIVHEITESAADFRLAVNMLMNRNMWHPVFFWLIWGLLQWMGNGFLQLRGVSTESAHLIGFRRPDLFFVCTAFHLNRIDCNCNHYLCGLFGMLGKWFNRYRRDCCSCT